VKSKNQEYNLGEILRCGRCAGILPDETLTFCPHCGNLFSNVPPTTAYSDLKLKQHQREKHREYFRFSLGFAGVFALGVVLYVSVFNFYRSQILEHIELDRKVVVYLDNQEKFPSYPMSVLRESVAIGIQAYSDHFDFPITHWQVVEGAQPDELQKVFKTDSGDDWQSLGFWKSFFDSDLMRQWKTEPYADLKVYMSNFPIWLRGPESKKVETKHLSESGLVSGLGHPGLVLLSTYRAMTEWKISEAHEASRFIGEYVFAHEMGHALLGFLDYVVPTKDYSMRGPASSEAARLSASLPGSSFGECLMHTDQGGGLKAWSQLRTRLLGQASRCDAYQSILEAHGLRREAVKMAREGDYKGAIINYQGAIEKIKGRVSPWLEYQWKHELELIGSL
jgi:hypothetical protein